LLLKSKKRKNEELITDGDKTLRFVADNGFGKAVNSLGGKDISQIFTDLSSGKLDIQDIENVIVCSLVDIDGEPVKEAEKVGIAQYIIDEYGLQECHQLCWLLLSHLMLGEKKSSKIAIKERNEAMMSAISGPSMSLKKAGLLWAVKLTVSTALVCMISSYYVINFTLSTT
jgi:hypothetical protein